MKRTRENGAAKIPDDMKSYLAGLYMLQEKIGTTRKKFVAEQAGLGLVFSPSQLNRWVARVNSTGTAILSDKLSGRISSLSRDQRDIASGWVLTMISEGVAVHRDSYCDFVKTQFKINITEHTAGNYLEDDGFTYRILKKKTSSFVVDVEKMRITAWNFVKNLKFPKNRSKILSLDFVYTGHRTERRSGYGVKGGAQPMEATPISRFTNCIVSAADANGNNVFKSVCYTYNQDFRRDRNPTELRQEKLDKIDECFRRYNVSPDRVVYVGKDKYQTETYVAESPDLLKRFFKKYKVPQGMMVLSDEGNAFSENGESVLLKLGFDQHVTFPPSVHQYLSVNDNPWHGDAKQLWRTLGVDFSDDAESSISLLSILDKELVKHGKYWFDRNLLGLTESGVADLISGAGGKKSHLHKDWKRAYRINMGLDARGEVEELPDNLNDGLDGLYWEK